MSKNNEITGLDINRDELEQAERVFKKNNLHFVYADIFKISNSLNAQFDVITLNGAIQYFSDFEKLMELLKRFLKPKGEIHIIDSPFYKKNDIKNAKKRTQNYFTKLGVPEMANNYFHHSIENLTKFEIAYKPSNYILKKIFRRNDSPYMWLILK